MGEPPRHGVCGQLNQCADTVFVTLFQVHVRHRHAKRRDGFAIGQMDGRPV